MLTLKQAFEFPFSLLNVRSSTDLRIFAIDGTLWIMWLNMIFYSFFWSLSSSEISLINRSYIDSTDFEYDLDYLTTIVWHHNEKLILRVLPNDLHAMENTRLKIKRVDPDLALKIQKAMPHGHY